MLCQMEKTLSVLGVLSGEKGLCLFEELLTAELAEKN